MDNLDNKENKENKIKKSLYEKKKLGSDVRGNNVGKLIDKFNKICDESKITKNK